MSLTAHQKVLLRAVVEAKAIQRLVGTDWWTFANAVDSLPWILEGSNPLRVKPEEVRVSEQLVAWVYRTYVDGPGDCKESIRHALNELAKKCPALLEIAL